MVFLGVGFVWSLGVVKHKYFYYVQVITHLLPKGGTAMKNYEESRIENSIQYLKSLEGFSERNVQAVQTSVRNMKLKECEPDTIRSYLSCLKRISPLIDFELDNVSRDDVEELALIIDNEAHPEYGADYGSYAAWTRSNDKAAVQTFCKYFFDDDKDYLFRNIRLTPKSSDRPNVDPEQLIDASEAEKLISSCSHPRDRAFLGLLWDTGMRRKEIAEIRWKDVIVQEDGMMKIHVRNGKNCPRTVFVYESVPLIDAWLSEYPNPQPEDLLWTDTRSHVGKREVSARALENIVAKARESTDIPERRKTNLHAWRKARATDMAAKGMNQPAMEDYFGWCRGSRMPRIYIELAEVDLENQVREIYGLERKRKQQKFIGENLEEYQEGRRLVESKALV